MSDVRWIKITTDIFDDEKIQLIESMPEGGVATPFGDKVVGYLKIAKIDLIEPIRIGASESHLNLGAAQVSGTGLPFGGNGNRSVLAGHRSWYGELRFFRVNELVVGDQIEVVLPHKTLVYEVYNQQVISANDWEQLLVKDNLDMLTLLTCEPVYPPFNYRLLVNAVRKPDAVKSSADYSNPRRTVSSVGTNEKVAESRFNGFYFIIGFGWVTVLYLLYRLYLARRDGK